jgi:hypothetical protein
MASNEELFDEFFGGQFMKAADFEEDAPPKRFRIGKAEPEDLRQMDGSGTKKKLVLSFVGHDKRLPLNKSNGRNCGVWGKDFAKWPGNMVELSNVQLDSGQRGIRLTPVVNGKAVEADGNDDGDDIPF